MIRRHGRHLRLPLDGSRRLCLFVVLLVSAWTANGAGAQSAPVPAGPESDSRSDVELSTVDRLVAVVDDDPIFLSDVDRLLALGLVETGPAMELDARRRTALDRLIEERLRLHEVERYELGTVPVPLVDRQMAALSARLGDGVALDHLLDSQDMDRFALRLLLRRQLRILAYIEERLGPRVSVTEEQIAAYYEDELRAEMEARGAPLPPLVEVEREIRLVLRERALNREIESWTEDLRRRADIVDLLGRRERQLPPVVFEDGEPQG